MILHFSLRDDNFKASPGFPFELLPALREWRGVKVSGHVQEVLDFVKTV
jgi:hypothetical protein